MSWNERLRQMVVAGGLLATGCSSSRLAGADAASTGAVGGTGGAVGGNGELGGLSGTAGTTPVIPCGNANPDPCICGRPDADATAAAKCALKTACLAAGGDWEPFVAPFCSVDLDAGVDGRSDGAPNVDGQTGDAVDD